MVGSVPGSALHGREPLDGPDTTQPPLLASACCTAWAVMSAT
jgi:hypothetical protein